MRLNLSFIAVWLVLAASAGCDRREVAGPPELKLGRQECAHCGMLINEDRCSSSLLVERGDRREHALFDDIGCMLDFSHDDHHDARVVECFVHDYPTRTWRASKDMLFLVASSEQVTTPMGSGIVAFSDRAAAEQMRTETGGELLDYDRVALVRRARTIQGGTSP